MAYRQHPYQPPVPPPPRVRPPPWGHEDPLQWCVRRLRVHTLWGSASIAFLILLFGAGMYGLFTRALYGEDVGGGGGLLLLLITPFVLAVVAAIATSALALNAWRLGKVAPGRPGLPIAKALLVVSIVMWGLLFVVFPISGAVWIRDDFPWGIVTVLPAYMGFCVAVYTTGAAMLAWSERNRVEVLMVSGLGWAALVMFLVLPITIATWDFGEGGWETVIFWIRFGNLFSAILPWLIVLGLFYVHGRSVSMAQAGRKEGEAIQAPPEVDIPEPERGECSGCGGSLTVHPRTREVFCAACGLGLSEEPEVPWPPLD